MWTMCQYLRVSQGTVTLQSKSSLDTISSWSSSNWMKLNAKKCQEILVCLLQEKPQLQPLQIDGQVLEFVSSYTCKVLGLVIESNLKWNEDVNAVVSKASKRLHAYTPGFMSWRSSRRRPPYHLLRNNPLCLGVLLCGMVSCPSFVFI